MKYKKSKKLNFNYLEILDFDPSSLDKSNYKKID